jgi:hypothetical protein
MLTVLLEKFNQLHHHGVLTVLTHLILVVLLHIILLQVFLVFLLVFSI